jgi:hypothetical protein
VGVVSRAVAVGLAVIATSVLFTSVAVVFTSAAAAAPESTRIAYAPAASTPAV